MLTEMMKSIADRPAPPTREAIERERISQLQLVQSVRMRLAESQCLTPRQSFVAVG